MIEKRENSNLEQRISHEWQRLQEQFGRINESGFENHTARLGARLAPAFQLQDRIVRCVDGGTPGGIHLAGAGVLHDASKAAQIVKQMGATGITSHEECGAAVLGANMRGEGHPETYSREWAELVAELAGIKYEGHIRAAELNREPELHNELVAYYDETGSFDYSRVEELPPGFIISRGLIGVKIAQKEAAVVTGIALGKSGFGDRFTEEKPFRLVIINDPRKKTIAEEELQAIVDQYGGRVVIDKFTPDERILPTDEN